MYYLSQPVLLKNLFLMIVIWITASFNFFMVAFQVKSFPGDFNKNTVAMFASDIPFYALGGLMLRILRPKTVFAIACLL